MKKNLEADIKLLIKELSKARVYVSKSSSTFISQKAFLTSIEQIALSWYEELEPYIKKFSIKQETIEIYSSEFKKLLRLSSGNNRTSSFEKSISIILGNIKNDILIPIQTEVITSNSIPGLDELFSKVTDLNESQYLLEAFNCARDGYIRAAIVLGWCATIDRIHKVIEKNGFQKFNYTSNFMADQTRGRFKNFNQRQNINSLNELRTVFDNVILWIIEGMQLIDSNQHTRLKSCFDMRNQSAHPGSAPTTPYNLLSFFSDIIEIVLINPFFELNN